MPDGLLKKSYVVGIRYRGREVIWDRIQIRAANLEEAQERLKSILFCVNGRYTLYEKTEDGLKEADE